MKKFTTIFTAAIFLVLVAASAFAYGPGGGRGACAGGACLGGDPLKAAEKLGLTAEQTAKMKELREQHLKDIKPLQDKMFSKRGDLRLLWLEKNPDQEKILALQKEIHELRGQFQQKATAMRLTVYNLLTPEQKDKVKTVIMGRGMARGPHHGWGGGKGFGPDGCPGRGMRGNW